MKNGVNERKFASSAVLARKCFLLKRNCVYGQIIIVMSFCISLIVYYESEFPFLDFCAIMQCVREGCRKKTPEFETFVKLGLTPPPPLG